jgi:hypothetical protein
MKYIILFTRVEQNQRILYRKFQTKFLVKTISINNKSYNINYEQPIYIDKKLNRIYILDVNSGEQLIPSSNTKDMSPDDLDTFLEGDFIKQFVKSASEDLKTKVLLVVFGAIMGFLAGALVFTMIMQNQINNLIQNKPTEVITLITGIRGLFW